MGMDVVTAETVDILTYDGHDVNDGATYQAWLGGSAAEGVDGSPIVAEVDFDWPAWVDTARGARAFALYVRILPGADWLTHRDELMGWFNTQEGDEQDLLASFVGINTHTRRIACRPIACRFDDHRILTVTLLAQRPYWEDETETVVEWTVTADRQTQVVTNGGNTPTPPVISFRIVQAPTAAWTHSKKCLVSNNVPYDLVDYPLEITGGGWDTAAEIANAAKTAAVNDAGNVGAADTTILYDTKAGTWYDSGLLLIDDEQIYYAGMSGTQFTGLVRGVNGTTAATHLDDAVIYQSEIAADGRDVRVLLDGSELDYWWGADPGDPGGPNDDDSLIWVVLPSLSAKRTDGDSALAGDLCACGEELAIGVDATVSASTPGHGGAQAVDGSTATSWCTPAGTKTGNLVLDLGAAVAINRVMLLHPNTDQALKTFTVQTSLNGSDWTTQVTVAANAVKGKWTAHDFPDAAARFVKVDVTDVQGAGASEFICLAEVRVYNAQARLTISYGQWTAAPRSQTDDTKPMFKLDTSTNAAWDFVEFYDATKPNRAASWVLKGWNRSFGKPDDTLAYKVTQDGTPADPASVIGVKNGRVGGDYDPYVDGAWLYNWCGVSQVVHSGGTQQDPDYRRWTVMGIYPWNGWTELSEISADTAGSFTAYGPNTWTVPVDSDGAYPILVRFWLAGQQYLEDYPDGATLAEASAVELTIATPPTVTLAAAAVVASCQFDLVNLTNGDRVHVAGFLATATWVDIDCEAWTVVERATGFNRLDLLEQTLVSVQDHWLQLEQGVNLLEYQDDSVVEVDIDVTYRERVL